MISDIMVSLLGTTFGTQHFFWLCILIADMCSLSLYMAGKKRRSGQRKWARIIWLVNGVAVRIFAFWLITG